MSRRRSRLRDLTALVAAFFFLFPLYLVIVNSLKPEEDILSSPAAPPVIPTFENYLAVLTRPDGLVWEGLWNSSVITITSVVIAMLISAMFAFALWRASSLVQNVVYGILLAGLILPTVIILVPVFKVLQLIGLANSMPGLVLFMIGYYVPFGTFVFRAFLTTVPRELVDAAMVDGASAWTTFFRIVFPLMRPATASVIVIIATWVWNDFLNPLILLGPLSGTTITVGLYRSVGQYAVSFGELFAFMMAASLPIIVLYFLLQRQFVRGLTSGTVK